MRYRIAGIRMPLDGGNEKLLALTAGKLHLPADRIERVIPFKKSIDARKKDNVHFIYTVEAEVGGKPLKKLPEGVTLAAPYHYKLPLREKLPVRPIVVGAGPAGLFAALILAQAGQEPILLERGRPVEERQQDVQRFWLTGKLDTSSNVQFGEGGAGTFSDGKLNTGTKDVRIRKVLEEFVTAGAPEEILYDAKPHVGTDRLHTVVKNLRETIRSLGGEVRFQSKVVGFTVREGAIVSVTVENSQGEQEELPARQVILAVGHSARDTFELLLEKGIALEQKAFSVGVRIEHLQESINRSQYGTFARHPALGAADYKLSVHLENGRGVYTFCMCPGGSVVAAASEEGRVVTNGMSELARDQKNANSALLVGIGNKDFGSDHPLAGVEFQRKLEARAFEMGGGNYCAPAQRVEDFLCHRPSKAIGEVLPSYRPGVTLTDLHGLFPGELSESLAEGIRRMDGFLQGFAHPDGILTGVESRSSSPVRILRDEGCQSVSVRGLYPCGEGAGYAGGIVSAAVDGIRCAEAILDQI